MKKLIFPFCLLLLTGLITVKQANSQSISEKEEVPWGQWIPCANDGSGEWVTGTLVLHIVIHLDKDGIIRIEHYNPQVTNLTGVITGDSFHGTGVSQYVFDSNSGGNGATTFTSIDRYHFIGKGIQFYIKETVHITVNANGIITADIDNFSVECE